MLIDACNCGGRRPFHLRRMALDARMPRKVDPTGTRSIRVRYEADLVRRFMSVRRQLRNAVMTLDVLGLKKTNLIGQIQSEMFHRLFNQPAPRRMGDAAPLPTQAFQFSRPSDKVESFLAWVDQMVQEDILGVTPGVDMQNAGQNAWQNLYIDTAYKKGMRDATLAINQAAGVAETEAGATNIGFNQPIHADRVGLIYTRAYRDLQGVTDAMDLGISRALAEGIANGDGPMQIARDLTDEVDNIGIVRARTLARTETIAAHAEGALNTYDEAGIQGVSADVEFATAGDNAVCPECADQEGQVYSIDDARGVIPVHPNCRCAWIPVVNSPEV